jgi:hypothetical protein
MNDWHAFQSKEMETVSLVILVIMPKPGNHYKLQELSPGHLTKTKDGS